MTGHPGGRRLRAVTATESAGGRDAGRVPHHREGGHEREVLPGLPGPLELPGPDRTVLEGGLPRGVRVDDVLSKLGNLGVEVLAVEPLDAVPTHPKER